MAVNERDGLALFVAIVLLVLGLIGGVIAAAFAVRQHHEDVAALHRDPSYRYGNNLNILGPPFNRASAPKPACTSYLEAHPARFMGFSLTKAVAGCVDAWNAATD